MREASIENDILDYLNYMGGCFWRTHTGRNQPCTPGVPDIVGVRQGQFIAVEVKRPGGKTTELQDAFLVRLRGCGALVFVATSVEDVQRMLA